TFSILYNNVQQNPAYLEVAKQGADGLWAHSGDKNGDWYFSLDKEGNPLTQPYNIFSDCFATIAYVQLFKATAEERYRDIAKSTFLRILERKDNAKGSYNKQVIETRSLKGFSLPMILCNLVLEI